MNDKYKNRKKQNINFARLMVEQYIKDCNKNIPSKNIKQSLSQIDKIKSILKNKEKDIDKKGYYKILRVKENGKIFNRK